MTFLFNATTNLTSNDCCRLPIQRDIELAVNLTLTLEQALLTQSISMERNLIDGLLLVVDQINSNWTNWFEFLLIKKDFILIFRILKPFSA
jgi:hypothetical protein